MFNIKTAKISVLLLALIMLSAPALAQDEQENNNEDIKILMLLGEWFGDTYFPLKERLEELNIKFVRVGVDEKYRGCYNKARDVELTSEILIPDFEDFSEYDCLLIPSGPQFRKFNENHVVLDFVKKAYDSGMIIASLCTGNMVVKAAKVVDMENPFDIEPGTVREVKDRVLMGSRGGGPPPGNGFEGAPVNELCDAILAKIREK
ncbi:DJ-1/PfpI family protein [candidate division KSB1 bacterium]